MHTSFSRGNFQKKMPSTKFCYRFSFFLERPLFCVSKAIFFAIFLRIPFIKTIGSRVVYVKCDLDIQKKQILQYAMDIQDKA